VRVIAGEAKGVPLAVPRHGTRPTTDRVREAVFSVFAGWAGTAGGPAESQLTGLSVLDLFAGSGAVAVEAASRGAGPVFAVDAAQAAVTAIAANAAATGLGVQPVKATAESFLSGPQSVAGGFDIVWLDPPYDLPDKDLSALLARLYDGWLATGALVAVERSQRRGPVAWPVQLAHRRSRRYGETVVSFAEMEEDEP